VNYFFDLEETIISEFDNPRLINIKKVNDMEYPLEVGVFSFAIWNERDRIQFSNYIQPMIEDAFGFKVITVPTMDEITSVVKQKWIAIEDRDDLFDFFDKERAFVEYCRIMFPGENCTLVDDRVPNMSIHENNTIIQTINITSF
jgi:hypothetical protein